MAHQAVDIGNWTVLNDCQRLYGSYYFLCQKMEFALRLIGRFSTVAPAGKIQGWMLSLPLPLTLPGFKPASIQFPKLKIIPAKTPIIHTFLFDFKN